MKDGDIELALVRTALESICFMPCSGILNARLESCCPLRRERLVRTAWKHACLYRMLRHCCFTDGPVRQNIHKVRTVCPTGCLTDKRKVVETARRACL